MDDLVEWLRRQIDDDERVALAASEAGRCGCHPACDTSGWSYDNGEEHVYTELHPVVGGPPFADVDSGVGEHIARHDPARVLREVEAKRRILDEHYIIERKVNWTDGEGEDRQTHLPVCVVCVPKYSYIGTPDQAVGPCKTVKLLAPPYADRPGYRQEWRP